MREEPAVDGKAILENLYEGVYLVSKDREILYWNKGAELLSGYSAAEVTGKHCADNLLRHIDPQGCELCTGACPLSEAMRKRQTVSAFVYMHHKEGYRVPISVKSFPTFDENGEVVGAIEIFERKEGEADGFVYDNEYKKNLYMDDVTKVGNKQFARVSVEQALGQVKNSGATFALMHLDIDDYANRLEQYGEAMGPRILRMTAGTLKALIRKRDILCRLENDDFVILFQNIGRETLERIAQRFLMFMKYSFIATEVALVQVSLSIGITMLKPDDGVNEVFERAERLMTRCRKNGKDRFSFE
jgi:diguanylate cyclase (GGDEF)-like protein/PAS domain S-box-containing protein